MQRKKSVKKFSSGSVASGKLNQPLSYVVVFIPALNEEEKIGEVIKKTYNLFKGSEKRGFWVDVIVVDDGSKDKTSEVARKAGAKAVFRHPYNRGLGAATRSGMQEAYRMGADIAVKIDADNQWAPEDIEKTFRPILDNEADVVFGSRFLEGKFKYSATGYTMVGARKWGNKFFPWLLSALTGLKVTDATTGLIAFARKYLANFGLASDYNETQQLIIDAWGRHMRVIEVPCRFNKRTTGRSFISWKYLKKVPVAIFRMMIIAAPLRIFIPLGLFFISLGFITLFMIILGQILIFGKTAMTVFFFVGMQMLLFGLLADQMSQLNEK